MRSLRYISFEGVEGSGKSTQARLFAESVGGVLTRENGGTPVGQRIRAITHDPDMAMSARTETLLFAADRAQHIDEVVLPALGQGKFVASDRSLWSSVAYQGYGRGLPVLEVERVSQWATDGTLPGIVFVLRVPHGVSKSRLASRRLDRIEQEGDEFFGRVSVGFDRMSAWAEGEWVYIDGDRPEREVADDILRHVVRIFEREGVASELPAQLR